MKRNLFLKLLCCACLVLLALTGWALAEEAEVEESQAQSAQMQLFTSGDIPMPRRMRSMTPPGFEQYMLEQLRAQPESIVVVDYQMTPDAFVLAVSSVINDNPELFYIGADVLYNPSSKGNVYRYFPQYLYTGDDLKKRIASFNATVDEIADYARSVSSTDIGRMLAVNDYFCINYKYDHSLSIYGPDQLFTGGTGVCQAYMLAYAAVLDDLGIENTHATSYAMVHTWNMVELDGSWYHVDVTWNDPDNGPLRTQYKYFLLSDAGMQNNRHYDWAASQVASDTTYDAYFWRSTSTPMGITGSKVFFLDDKVADGGIRTIRLWNIGADTTSAVHSFSIADASGAYSYTEGVHAITADASKVYFGVRNNLYSIRHSGADETLLYSSNDGRFITACWMQGSSVQLQLANANGGNVSTFKFVPSGAGKMLVLPEAVTTIGEEAFFATAAWGVELPSGVKSIGARAFGGSSKLTMVYIPASVNSISDSAFEGSANVTLVVENGSYAQTYAKNKGLNWTLQ